MRMNTEGERGREMQCNRRSPRRARRQGKNSIYHIILEPLRAGLQGHHVPVEQRGYFLQNPSNVELLLTKEETTRDGDYATFPSVFKHISNREKPVSLYIKDNTQPNCAFYK